MQGTPWNYAAATGGIDTSSTAVEVKAALTGRRHRVRSIQIAHATLGAATEFVIQTGAGPTVLWRTLLHTTAQPDTTIVFESPLMGDFGGAIEIKAVSAVTGDILCNVQGDTV